MAGDSDGDGDGIQSIYIELHITHTQPFTQLNRFAELTI